MIEISTDIVLQVSNLTKIYGRELTLGRFKLRRKVTGAQDVSFSVEKGEIFGFLGPNGAGKTTTMRSILGYLNIQTGSIKVFDLDHRKDSIEIRKRIGYVPGDLSLYEDFTGEELIRYLDKFQPVDNIFLKELKSTFKVDLTQKIGNLSTGNRQQVGVIIALAPKPDLLILDEPTSGLDPLMTAKAHEIFKKLRDEGKTIFLSSHDLSEVQAICDRVGIIKEGKMILIERIEDLKQKFLQNVKIKFSSKTLPKEDDFKRLDSIISAEKTNETTFKLIIKEDVNELLKLLINYKIKRFTIEDASLEEIFLKFYM
ncbi:MAG: ABC transporter ATP-binding protein [Candidatus Lokiarchaeota archaeon]|nr:ABC transporter ATP-binding protein [Candidatus Lokiarchaeota archaeon]